MSHSDGVLLVANVQFELYDCGGLDRAMVRRVFEIRKRFYGQIQRSERLWLWTGATTATADLLWRRIQQRISTFGNESHTGSCQNAQNATCSNASKS
jgi:hypothetical protein